MEKLVYLLRVAETVRGQSLRAALLEKAALKLRTAGAMQIGISIDDEAVAAGAGVRIRRADPPIRALVSFWMHNADDREACESALAECSEDLSGYLVAESRPMRFDVPKGQRAPGTNLVTCIRKRPDLNDDSFFDLWNNEHKKVALETQSTFAYTRNAVLRALTPSAHPWDGVVEESFPLEALSDPKVWYDCDSDAEYQKRLSRMIGSVKGFLDLSDMESIPMSEYFLG
jgi:hypothetical protein